MVFPGDIIWYFLIFLVWCKLKKTRAGDACIADDDDGGVVGGGGGDDDDDDDVDDNDNDDDDDDDDNDDAVLVGVGFEEVDLHTLPESTAPKGKLLLLLLQSTVTLLLLQSIVTLLHCNTTAVTLHTVTVHCNTALQH